MRPTLAALSALLLLVCAPAAAGAQEQDAEVLTGRIQPGLDGFAVPGRPTPVLVTVTASELVTGELGVGLGAGPAEIVDLEVTGGSSEEHWLLLDAPNGLPGRATAAARLDDREIDLDSAPIQWDPEVHLVGTLAGLGGLELGDSDTRFGGHELHVVDLQPALLDLGPGALSALDSVALTPDDVAGLSDRHRQTLLGWLGLGGTMYVDAEPGTLVDWPEALQPTAPVVRSGAARVVATGGALAEGRWSEVLSPAPNRSVQEDGSVAQTLPFGNPAEDLFAADLGRDLPGLTGLLAILAVYAVLVGPVAHVAFRRRVMGRWVAIPALAVVATGVLYLRGDGPGAEASASVVDVIETSPGSAMATTQVLMATDSGGRHVVAPAGWTAEQDEMFGPGQQIRQRRRAGGVEIDVPAQAGGVGLLSASGPADVEGALEVEASAVDDGTVAGVVRNTTEVHLQEVAVFAGRAASALVGDLAPGATAEFELTGANQFRFGADPFGELWGHQAARGAPMVAPTIGPEGPGAPMPAVPAMECDQFGNCFPVGGGGCVGPGCEPPPERTVRTSSLSGAMRDRGVNAMAPGVVTAVGWTTDLDPVVDLGRGVDVAESVTAVVGRAVPAVPGDRLVDAAVVRHLVGTSTAPDGRLELLFRFDLPAEVGGRAVDPARLRIDAPMMFDRLEILGPGGAHVLRDREPGGAAPADAPGREEVVVPPDAVVGGQVFVRTMMPLAPPGPGRELVIYEAET